MSPWAAGQQLGPYTLLSPAGAGGMGEVWKARDTRLNRIVAVKRLKGEHNARFEQEARAIAALNHPHICQIHDIGPDYLVLEYIEGAPIRGPHPPEEAVRLAAQIAEALDAAHHKGVVHRDLKPANIMVTTEGSVKLLDFGLAKQVTDSNETATIEGTVMGTAAYMAPEQAEGKPLDARSDVFSFGAVLYELLSGRRAFSGENSISTMAAILHKEPKALDASPALQQIVKRCLAKQPANRFQTMADLRAALEVAPVSAPDAEESPSIAVLPFSNMSADKENEYFSDGLAEEIINELAQIPGLKVTARTSAFAFRGKEQDIQKIAEALHVKTILEGSVRRAGTRIRVMAQLINAADGYHLWSQRYDREMADIFELQDEIAQAIASALHLKLSGTPAAREQYKPSLPAYEALLKARYYIGRMNPDVLPRIKESFEQAIALDPKFALAHCEYGIYFLMMAVLGSLPANQVLPLVRAHAQKALELDASIPEGHAMLGLASAFLEYDWKEAERHFHTAVAHQPVPPLVRILYAASCLTPAGRETEAVQQVELALQEDPLNPLMQIQRAITLAAAGRDEDAARRLLEILEMDPTVGPANGYLAVHHLVRGDMDQALAFQTKAFALTPQVPYAIGGMAGLLARTGNTAGAEALIQKLQPDAFGASRALAIYHWMLGDLNAMADWIEKAIDQHDPAILLMLRQWYGRELRNTPRWAGLMRKLNLPEN
jgi:TolB-like protein/tRNA A-37 threonylcarbamoyl transferase component Bud32